ncbi:MAG: protein kinase [Myxococcota bacterium]
MTGVLGSAYGHLGPYLLLDRLAGGGMGEVYLAHRRGLAGFEKLLVLKRILPNLAGDPSFVEMFLNEARLAATLEHPNVVRVYDLGEAAGAYFLTMEYLHGVTLGQLMAQSEVRDRTVPIEHALAIITGVARGVHYAHEKKGLDGTALGIVHRDVSPSNVFITFDGATKILDFGVARALHATSRITDGDAIKGKVSYMSPEQVKGETIDRRSDVFAIGVLLYELTTGHRMFAGDNRYAIMNRVAAGRYEAPSSLRPDFPPELTHILDRALATDPDDRYPTALALHRDLEDYAAANGMGLSPVGLADCVGQLFDRPEYPSFAVPSTHPEAHTEAAPGQTVVTGPPGVASGQPAAGGRRGVWTAVVAVGVAASAAFAIGSTRGDAPAAAGPTPVAEPAASAGEAKPPPQSPASAVDPRAAPSPSEPSPSVPSPSVLSPSILSPSEPSPPAPSPPESAARSAPQGADVPAKAPAKKQRRRAKRRGTDKNMRGLDGLLPSR